MSVMSVSSSGHVEVKKVVKLVQKIKDPNTFLEMNGASLEIYIKASKASNAVIPMPCFTVAQMEDKTMSWLQPIAKLVNVPYAIRSTWRAGSTAEEKANNSRNAAKIIRKHMNAMQNNDLANATGVKQPTQEPSQTRGGRLLDAYSNSDVKQPTQKPSQTRGGRLLDAYSDSENEEEEPVDEEPVDEEEELKPTPTRPKKTEESLIAENETLRQIIKDLNINVKSEDSKKQGATGAMKQGATGAMKQRATGAMKQETKSTR